MVAAYCRVTAIVRVDRLEQVERSLRELRVSGVSVSRVKGYGEYADFFARDWMTAYARVEIFTGAQNAGLIAGAVLRAASTGTRGDGIVAVEPVESVLRIRSSAPIPLNEI